MAGIDWLQFKKARQAQRAELRHSAKGTTWKEHKYIEKKPAIKGGGVRYVYEAAKQVERDKQKRDAAAKQAEEDKKKQIRAIELGYRDVARELDEYNQPIVRYDGKTYIAKPDKILMEFSIDDSRLRYLYDATNNKDVGDYIVIGDRKTSKDERELINDTFNKTEDGLYKLTKKR